MKLNVLIVAGVALTCGVLAAPAAAETPMLAGTTTFSVSGPAALEVALPVIPAPQAIEPTFVEGRASIVLRALVPPPGEREPLWHASGQPGSWDREQIRDLPAGHYRVYVLPEAGSRAVVKLAIAELSGTLALRGTTPVPAHDMRLEGVSSPQFPNTVVVGAAQAARGRMGWTTVDLGIPNPGLGRVQWCTSRDSVASDSHSYDIGCPGGAPENGNGLPPGDVTVFGPLGFDNRWVFFWLVAPPWYGFGGNASSITGDAQALLAQRWLTFSEADAAIAAAQHPPARAKKATKKKKEKQTCRQ